MSSQLKGTMIGAAPIDPAALAAALDRRTAQPATAQPATAQPATAQSTASDSAFGGTMLAPSQPFGAQQSHSAQQSHTAQAMNQLGNTQPFEQSAGGSGWAPPAPQRSEFTNSSTIPAPAARPLATMPPAKSNLPVIVLIVLVVVLALALVGFGVALRSRSEEPAQPGTPTAAPTTTE